MDDLSRRSLRELLTLARERLGRSAAGLKTRGELIAALRQEPGGDGVVAADPAVTSIASAAVAPARDEAADVAGPAARGSAGAPSASSSPSTSERAARAGDPPTVVTRDFFIARH